jgi:hypothetical protein
MAGFTLGDIVFPKSFRTGVVPSARGWLLTFSDVGILAKTLVVVAVVIRTYRIRLQVARSLCVCGAVTLP